MNYMRIIFKKFKARMIVGCILAVIALLAVSVIVFINQASFGRTPRGERLERVMKSPNYRNGEFKNQHETLLMTSDRGVHFQKDRRFAPRTGCQSNKNRFTQDWP